MNAYTPVMEIEKVAVPHMMGYELRGTMRGPKYVVGAVSMIDPLMPAHVVEVIKQEMEHRLIVAYNEQVKNDI